MEEHGPRLQVAWDPTYPAKEWKTDVLMDFIGDYPGKGPDLLSIDAVLENAFGGCRKLTCTFLHPETNERVVMEDMFVTAMFEDRKYKQSTQEVLACPQPFASSTP